MYAKRLIVRSNENDRFAILHRDEDNGAGSGAGSDTGGGGAGNRNVDSVGTKNGAIYGTKNDPDKRGLVLKIKDLPKEERPRELLMRRGVEKLTTPEILAIVIRSGNSRENALQLAERLYITYPLHELAHSSVSDLSGTLGIGTAKACQILASMELGKRLQCYESKPVFTRPSEAAYFLMPELSHLPQEHFKCLYLNRRNRLVHDRTLFVGTSGESLVEPATILREALVKNASSIILAHNHPSGDPTPSRQDIEMTERITDAGIILGIEVFDHIIIGHENFVSLAERGLMPER